jgi:hypothetical protein
VKAVAVGVGEGKTSKGEFSEEGEDDAFGEGDW